MINYEREMHMINSSDEAANDDERRADFDPKAEGSGLPSISHGDLSEVGEGPRWDPWGGPLNVVSASTTVGQAQSLSQHPPTLGSLDTPSPRRSDAAVSGSESLPKDRRPGAGSSLSGDDLGPAGAALLTAIRAKYDLRADEQVMALSMARIVDRCELLTKAVSESGSVVVAGSKGQPAVHPAVVEERLQWLAFARLASALGLPDDVAVIGATAASRKSIRAANSRWLAEGPRLIEGASLDGDS